MKTRISELAHELRCKAKEILDALPGLGITRPAPQKVTHSTSLEVAEADAVRKHFAANPDLAEPQVDHVTLGRAKSIAAQFGEEI